MPIDRIKDEALFKKQVEEDAVTFKPMGEKIHSYVRKKGSHKGKDPRDRVIGKSRQEEASEHDENAVTYEVYHVRVECVRGTQTDCAATQANWATPGFLEFHRRMQIFILLYIEAGSYIQEDEEKWEFVTLSVHCLVDPPY